MGFSSLSKQEKAAAAGSLLVALRMLDHVAKGDFDKDKKSSKEGKKDNQ